MGSKPWQALLFVVVSEYVSSNHVTTWERDRGPTTIGKPQLNELRRGRGKDTQAKVDLHIICGGKPTTRSKVTTPN